MDSPDSTVQQICFSSLAKNSWQALSGKWGITIGIFLIAVSIQTAANYVPVLGAFSGWLLFPLTAGVTLFMLRVVRNEQPLDIGLIFDPFNQYWRFVWGNLRMGIFTFLWTLLLIIPGIIAGIRYSMTVYIMLDKPDCTAKEAMTESIQIMYGHKLQFFGYSLLFGLIVFSGAILTLGIGLIWLIPWSAAFTASFYDSIRIRPKLLPEETEIPAADQP